MIKANMVVKYNSVTGIGDSLIFESEGLKLIIEDIDISELIDEIRYTGYLKDYIKENKDYIKECF